MPQPEVQQPVVPTQVVVTCRFCECGAPAVTTEGECIVCEQRLNNPAPKPNG